MAYVGARLSVLAWVAITVMLTLAVGVSAVTRPAWLLAAVAIGCFVVLVLIFDETMRDRSLDLLSPTILFPVVYLVFFLGGSLNTFLAPPPGFEWALFARPVSTIVPLLSAFGLAFYYVGIMSARFAAAALRSHGATASTPWKGRPRRQVEWSPHRVRVATVALLTGATACALLAFRQSGVPLLSGSVATERLVVGSQNGALITLFSALVISSSGLATVAAFGFGGPSRFDLSLWISAIFVAGVLTVLLGGRALFAEVLLFVWPVLHYTRSRAMPLAPLLLIGGAAMLGLSAFGFWRDSQSSGSAALQHAYSLLGVPDQALPFAPAYAYWRNTVVALDQLISTVPSFYPYQHGAMFMAGAAGLLPGHHDSADILFRDLLGLQFTTGLGVPASLLGIYYVDFGVAGIAVGMFLLGATAELIYRTMVRRTTFGTVLAYGYVFKLAMWSLFAGPFPFVATLAAPLALAISASYARERRTARPSAWLGWAATGGIAAVALVLLKGATT